MMKHPFTKLARLALALLWMACSLPACQSAAVPTLPAGAGEPVQVITTNIPTSSTAAVGKTVVQIPTQTLLPTATPLPQIEPPIVWYLRGVPPADLPRVNEQINQELAARGFQARVEMRIIAEAAYERQMADDAADESWNPGETWDLAALSASSYPDWLEKGRLLSLTAYRNPQTDPQENLFETQLPGLQASLPQQALAGLLRAGNLSAVPNQGAWVRPRGVSIRADVVSALDLREDLERVHTFDDLSPLLAKIQAAVVGGALKDGRVADGDQIRRAVGLAGLLEPQNAGYDVLWGPFVVAYNDAQGGVVNWHHTQAFQELALLRQAWQRSGYLPDETLTPEQASQGYQAGQYVVEIGRPVWPGSAIEQAQRYGYDWIEKPLSPAFLSTNAVLSSLTVVNAWLVFNTQRLQRVMLLLEWLHTDAELYNLLVYGIEGRHWQWSDREKQVITLASGSHYRPDYAGQIGNRTLSYTTGDQPAGLWQAVAQENAQALASPALGFRFDTRPVAAESAAVRGIMMELEDPLSNGQVEDIERAVDKLEKALEEAGLDAIRVELEEQFRAWKK